MKGPLVENKIVKFVRKLSHPEITSNKYVCISISDGDAAKAFIMSNEDVLKKVASYVVHTHSKLQVLIACSSIKTKTKTKTKAFVCFCMF